MSDKQTKGKEGKIIHNIGSCEHKTFFGMTRGHCIKCGKAYKNCDICFPNERNKECEHKNENWTITSGKCPWCGKKIKSN